LRLEEQLADSLLCSKMATKLGDPRVTPKLADEKREPALHAIS